MKVVQSFGTTPWYTDNAPEAERLKVLDNLVAGCQGKTKIPLVIYGVPNKDCVHGYTNKGTNKNAGDYEKFIGELSNRFSSQHMVYVVEPDALGLMAGGGCGSQHMNSLLIAVKKLSENPNAELFMDVGYWTLFDNTSKDAVVKAFKQLAVRGVGQEAQGYQKTDKMLELCESFARSVGDQNLKCVIDTSRNNKGPTPKNEWCNANVGSIDVPPTMNTGSPRAAYFLWIKPPGESDGTCDKQSRDESLVGPAAGEFFKEHFDIL